MVRGIFVFALFAALFFGCKPAEPVFPAEPILSFKKYIQNGDGTLQVVFSFTDGDGDIGVAPTDTIFNMELTAYHKDPTGTAWVVIPNATQNNPNDSLHYNYRIPRLTAGQEGLQGEIYVTIATATLYAVGEDTLQFNSFLLDQSQHKSAVIRTPEVDLLP